MSQQLTDQSRAVHKVYLSAFDVGSLICALQNTARVYGIAREKRDNCWTAIRWLEHLKDGKSLIQQVELESPRIYLERIANVAIAENFVDVGQRMLQQIAEVAE